MSKIWPLWAALGVWVSISIATHLFYIKRIRFDTELVLPPVPIIDGTQLRVQLTGALFQQAEGTLQPFGSLRALDTLAAYLVAHPRRLLTVTGYHTPAENKLTLIKDLGAMRAAAVQQYLVDHGVPQDQLQRRGETAESIFFVHDSTNALSFAFRSVLIDANWLARHQRYIDLFHPLQLYFPTGSTSYIQTPDNQRFAREVIPYLRNHRHERLVISGHTDSTGTKARNLSLSRLRATAVRNQLQQLGAPNRWFRIVARGAESPIALNTLMEGREANRRVTLLIERR